MSEGFFSDQVTVKIGDADAATTDLTAITTFITNFSESGGGRDTTSKPLFGGANFTNQNPRAQFEVSFDVIVPPGDNSVLWDNIMMNETGLASTDLTSTSVTSSGEGVAAKLEIEWNDGSNTYNRTYNNIYGFEFNPEQSAEDELRGNVSFKMAATDSTGTSNLTVTRT